MRGYALRVPDVDRAHVRLAELVAALSLGIDLGFGQPMEHVLRQCLIALRLAERVGLDEQQRAVVYYTALLINVGCHTDAHEQAKWFGDDIALKAGKYDHEMRSVGGAAATMRLLGSGNPPLHRFRSGLEFAVSGHRDLDGMIAHHAQMARVAGGAARAARRRCWTRSAAPTSSGTARLAGQALGRGGAPAEPDRAARRVRGGGLPRRRRRSRPGARARPRRQAVRSLADRAHRAATRDLILSGIDEVDTWEAVIAAEPALAVVLSGERFDAALAAIANFIDLKSPYTLGHARGGRRAGGGGGPPSWGSRRARSARSGVPGWCTTSAGSGYRTRSGTSAGRSAWASGSGSGFSRT